jgi:hypothetical protein
MKSKSARSAIEAIKHRGILLVFPMDNRKEPASIWSEFYPKSEMRWEWDETGDNRVADLWHLRAQLSNCNEVVYTKWFRGRATFLSREIFTALLRLLGSPLGLSRQARDVLDTLEMDSPLSTKQLKKATDLQGRLNESAYQRALKELWSRMLIVGYGEIDDGAFPSLAIGSTRLLFEDLFADSRKIAPEAALKLLEKTLGEDSLWFKHYLKLAAGMSAKQDMERLSYSIPSKMVSNPSPGRLAPKVKKIG